MLKDKSHNDVVERLLAFEFLKVTVMNIAVDLGVLQAELVNHNRCTFNEYMATGDLMEDLCRKSVTNSKLKNLSIGSQPLNDSLWVPM